MSFTAETPRTQRGILNKVYGQLLSAPVLIAPITSATAAPRKKKTPSNLILGRV